MMDIRQWTKARYAMLGMYDKRLRKEGVSSQFRKDIKKNGVCNMKVIEALISMLPEDRVVAAIESIFQTPTS